MFLWEKFLIINSISFIDTRLSGLLLLSCESSLYNLGSNPLSDMWFPNISPSLYLLLNRVFQRAKDFNFDQLQFIIFSFMVHAFDVKFKTLPHPRYLPKIFFCFLSKGFIFYIYIHDPF